MLVKVDLDHHTEGWVNSIDGASVMERGRPRPRISCERIGIKFRIGRAEEEGGGFSF